MAKGVIDGTVAITGGALGGIETGLIPRSADLWTNTVYEGIDITGEVRYVGIH